MESTRSLNEITMHTSNASPPILMLDEFMVSVNWERGGWSNGSDCRPSGWSSRSGHWICERENRATVQRERGTRSYCYRIDPRGRERSGGSWHGPTPNGLRGVHVNDQANTDHSRLSSRMLSIHPDFHRSQNRRDLFSYGSEKTFNTSTISHK